MSDLLTAAFRAVRANNDVPNDRPLVLEWLRPMSGEKLFNSPLIDTEDMAVCSISETGYRQHYQPKDGFLPIPGSPEVDALFDSAMKQVADLPNGYLFITSQKEDWKPRTYERVLQFKPENSYEERKIIQAAISGFARQPIPLGTIRFEKSDAFAYNVHSHTHRCRAWMDPAERETVVTEKDETERRYDEFMSIINRLAYDPAVQFVSATDEATRRNLNGRLMAALTSVRHFKFDQAMLTDMLEQIVELGLARTVAVPRFPDVTPEFMEKAQHKLAPMIGGWYKENEGEPYVYSPYAPRIYAYLNPIRRPKPKPQPQYQPRGRRDERPVYKKPQGRPVQVNARPADQVIPDDIGNTKDVPASETELPPDDIGNK